MAMAKIYADLIMAGIRTLNKEKQPDLVEVPNIMFAGQSLRQAVIDELNSRGVSYII